MYLAFGTKERHWLHSVDQWWAFVAESNARAPKKFQKGSPTGGGGRLPPPASWPDRSERSEKISAMLMIGLLASGALCAFRSLDLYICYVVRKVKHFVMCGRQCFKAYSFLLASSAASSLLLARTSSGTF